MPIENFTKNSLVQFKKTLDATKIKRVKTAKVPEHKPSKISNLLHGKDTEVARAHFV
jgi:hypothetical protein